MNIGVVGILVVQSQNPPDEKESHAVHENRRLHHLYSQWIVKERVRVIWLNQTESGKHHDRQQANDDPAEAPFRGQCPDLQLYAMAAPDRLRKTSDNFRQAGAGLRLS